MRTTRHNNAFSIIELLVVIGIIGILLSLLLPALAQTRAAAKQTQALSNGRQIGISFSQYADRYGAYPYGDDQTRIEGAAMTPPPGIMFIPWFPDGVIIGTSDYFSLSFLWPALMRDVAPFEENYKLWVSPGIRAELPELGEIDLGNPDFELRERLQVSWLYSNSFQADPRLWSDKGSADPSFYRAIRPDDVQFPANKVMLWDGDVAWLPKDPKIVGNHYLAPTPMVFGDLHAAVHNPVEASEGYPNPLRGGDVTKLHNTPDGVSGTDY